MSLSECANFVQAPFVAWASRPWPCARADIGQSDSSFDSLKINNPAAYRGHGRDAHATHAVKSVRSLALTMVVTISCISGISRSAVADTAPSTPAHTPISDSFSKEPIRRDGSVAATSPSAKEISIAPSANALEPAKVIAALAGVVGLIFVLRWAAKKFVPGAVAHRSSRAMTVISRCTIAPRQHILLVQVGKRLIVVGDGGSQLSPLCQITDEAEVSTLLGQIRNENSSIASRFDSIFGKARKGFDAEEAVETTAMTRQDSNSVIETPEAPSEDHSEDHEALTPELAATRDELKGLTSKVRGLAQQLGRA